jgi:hypothetical protein
MTSPAKKDLWDKLPAVAAVIASILVPLTVAFVGNAHSSAMKASENRVKYVELAVSILRVEPNADNTPLRGWAADVLNNESPIPLSPEALKSLKETKLKYWDDGDWSKYDPSMYRYNSQSYENPSVDFVEYGGSVKNVPRAVRPSTTLGAAK